MTPFVLSDSNFEIEIDSQNGSIQRIAHPADRHKMNWLSSSRDNAWHACSQQWGLGFANLGRPVLRRGRWEKPASLRMTARTCTVVYSVAGLRVTVARRLDGRGRVHERYTFKNLSSRDFAMNGRNLDAFSIYTPFNDNYTGAAICIPGRCNAHLWCGGHVAYACCLRMGGDAPHLGLVLTEGNLSAYSVEGRDRWVSSNTRGILMVHPDLPRLKPRETFSLGWTLFWHEGWEDFFRQAAEFPGFIRISAPQYTVELGGSIDVRVESHVPLARAKMTVNGEPVKPSREKGALTLSVPAKKTGEHRIAVEIGGRTTRLDAFVTPRVMDLIEKRVEFIATRQQWHAPGEPLDGAFVLYDNEAEKMMPFTGRTDCNEARERLAMGVLMALYLQKRRNATVTASLKKYDAFCRRELQDRRYDVNDGVGRTYRRMYNYPWMAQLHLEMYTLTQDIDRLKAFQRTMCAYYKRGGDGFYAFGIPILDGITALDEAGLKKERRKLLADFERHAHRIMERGTNYPVHEVVYEQSIVAPAVTTLMEVYLVTRKREYLDGVRDHLRALETFNGRQPSYHMNEIAIRHWDGYYFGKRMCWGDTLPHYWSVLSAVAFWRYGQATGDASYCDRARETFRNNLCLFTPDGRGSCAYVYLCSVNGELAMFYDAYANDQDWALVHWMQIERDAEWFK